MGVLLTDTIMFLVFLSAAFIAIPYVTSNAGGWFEAIHNLAASSTSPGIISWHSNLSYMYPTGGQNIAWAVTYGIVWMLVVMVLSLIHIFMLPIILKRGGQHEKSIIVGRFGTTGYRN